MGEVLIQSQSRVFSGELCFNISGKFILPLLDLLTHSVTQTEGFSIIIFDVVLNLRPI